MSSSTKIHSVWAHNLDSEFALIRNLVDLYPFAAMDTEFPGVLHRPIKPPSRLHPSDLYSLLKSNVDSLNLIQLGLTLSSDTGGPAHVWEFNFSDFDLLRDPYSPDSIDVLRSSGIDFDRNVAQGIDSRDFVVALMSSGLILNESVRWITFHSSYDFGYMVKILTGKSLPDCLEEFMELVRVFFGDFLDLKHMMRYCDGLYGGLDRVAGALKVERAAGKSHQAGSDSLLTWHTYLRMREVFFSEDHGRKHAGVLFGLEI